MTNAKTVDELVDKVCCIGCNNIKAVCRKLNNECTHYALVKQSIIGLFEELEKEIEKKVDENSGSMGQNEYNAGQSQGYYNCGEDIKQSISAMTGGKR